MPTIRNLQAAWYLAKVATHTLILASIPGATVLKAQGFGPQLGVAGGVAVPTGAYHGEPSTYGEGFKTGWQGMVLTAFRIPAWPLGFRLDATYSVNNANTTLTNSNDEFSTERSKALGADLDLSWSLPPLGVAPYLIGGVGVYHTTIAITGGRFPPADTSQTTFAWNAGVGVVYTIRALNLFLEARYVSVAGGLGFSCPLGKSCPRQPGPRTTFVPIMAGIRLGKP